MDYKKYAESVENQKRFVGYGDRILVTYKKNNGYGLFINSVEVWQNGSIIDWVDVECIKGWDGEKNNQIGRKGSITQTPDHRRIAIAVGDYLQKYKSENLFLTYNP